MVSYTHSGNPTGAACKKFGVAADGRETARTEQTICDQKTRMSQSDWQRLGHGLAGVTPRLEGGSEGRGHGAVWRSPCDAELRAFQFVRGRCGSRRYSAVTGKDVTGRNL